MLEFVQALSCIEDESSDSSDNKMHEEDQRQRRTVINIREEENNEERQWDQDAATILIPESVELPDLLGTQHDNMLKFLNLFCFCKSDIATFQLI